MPKFLQISARGNRSQILAKEISHLRTRNTWQSNSEQQLYTWQSLKYFFLQVGIYFVFLFLNMHVMGLQINDWLKKKANQCNICVWTIV